ncbi:MAG: sigma-70 family RNA polymerase sigma factor [Myxococcota bacterium]
MAVAAQLEVEAEGASFEDVYRAHREQVLGWAMRYCAGRRDHAEDVAHDVFLKLHQHFERLAALEEVGAWLYRVTVNEALSRLRRERSFGAKVKRLFFGEEDSGPAADHDFERHERTLLVERALRALPDKERVVVCLWALDGLAQKDIARTLSLSEGYVSKLLARAQERLAARGWEVTP